VSAVWGALERSSVDQGRTSPVRLSSFIALDPHAESGGGLGRKRSIQRRISAYTARGTATSELEDDVAAMAHDPGADLDQLLAQRGQRSMPDPLRQGQRAQEVGEVVGQRVQLEPHAVCRRRHGKTAASSGARSCPRGSTRARCRTIKHVMVH
jgi:hypothetical protein